MNPFDLPPEQRRVFELCLDSVWAEETLRDRGGRFDSKTIRKLTLMATDDEEAADRACAEAMLAEIDAKNGK